MNKVLLLILLVLPQWALAQDRIRFPEGSSSWTVALRTNYNSPAGGTAQSSSVQPPHELKKIEVSQSGDARRSILYWADGHKKEVWGSSKSNVIITEEPSGGTIATTNNDFFGAPFAPSALEWVKSAALVEDKPVQFEDKDCFHYRHTIVEAVEEVRGKFGQISIPCEAWIDSKTLLPVVIIRGATTAKFTFGPPPGSLVMPDKFRKRLDYYKLVMGGQ